MRLSIDLMGAERPAARGARLAAANAGQSAGEGAAFDLSALLSPTLVVPQPATPLLALALGVTTGLPLAADGGDAAAAGESAKSAVAKKTLPLMFLRPEFDAVPAETNATHSTNANDTKAHARHRKVHGAHAKRAATASSDPSLVSASPLQLIAPTTATDNVAPIPTPLSVPATPTAPPLVPTTATPALVPMTTPPSLPVVSVELVMSALDAPEELPVPAVELLKAQLLSATAKSPAIETPATVAVAGNPVKDSRAVTERAAVLASAAGTPMLMADVGRESPKAAPIDLRASAERGIKILKSAEGDTTVAVQPALAAHQTSADHDAQRAVRLITNLSSRAPGAASSLSVSTEASFTAGASADRSTLSQLPSRLIESMRMQIHAGGGQAEIRLTPDSLGSIKVSIVVDHGSVKATLTAETPAALAALRADVGGLRHALEERGLRLDEFELREDPSFARQPGGSGAQDTPDEPQQRRHAPAPQALGISEFSQAFDVVA